jgi:hypothetical protein
MVIEVPPIIIGGLAFFLVGGAWMLLYWRVLDPLLRRVVGRMVGATINRGEQFIWVANEESEDSISWRAAVIRPIQMTSIFAAGMVALVIGLAVTIWLSQ